MIRLRYGVLCDVEVLHDYFLNLDAVAHEALVDAVRSDLLREYAADSYVQVQPTQGTGRTLAGQRMLFKTTPTGFRIGVLLDGAASDERPAVSFPLDLTLSFYVRILDREFYNYTAVAGDSAQLYRFSNTVGNASAGRVFLSSAVPAFDPARAYAAGELYADTTGSLSITFQALRDTTPNATPVSSDWQRIPADTYDASVTYAAGSIVLSNSQLFRARVDGPGTVLTNPADWEALGPIANQYVTHRDRIELNSGLLEVDVSSATLTEATLRVFAEGTATPAVERTVASDSGTLSTLQIDARRVRPGAYRFEVLDASFKVLPQFTSRVYIDADAVRGGWVAVIELRLATGASALLDAGGALRSPVYTLRFVNRATRWRYLFPRSQPLGSGAEVAVEAGDARVLVTTGPRALTRFGDGVRLQADDSTTAVSEEVLLPRAEPHLIRHENAQWYSEIHTLNLQL